MSGDYHYKQHTHVLKIGRFFYWMLAFVPISFAVAILTADKTLIFVAAILALIPLARILGYATKEISLQSNPTISGLVSATFGNSIELIIAVLALQQGLIRLVQASIVGSIIGNILLLTGLSVFFGGLRYKKQFFNKEVAGVSSTMLIIAVAGLTIPTMFSFTNPSPNHIMLLSVAVAIVMAMVYIAGLVFSLLTHRDLFDASDEIRAARERPNITIRMAALILLITTIIAAVESELLVRSVEEAAIHIGLTQTFIGVVVIAIITNIAEKANAVNFARENKLDISLEIGMSSAIQIALFVVPVLVLVSQIFGYGFTLVFSMFEAISIFLAVLIINYLSADGTCNWLEGAQLMTVYLIIATAFFFIF